MPDRMHQFHTYFSYLLLAGLSIYLALYVWAALAWRMTLDTPLMAYVAFLDDRFGLVPYRDIFTMSFPGTQAFHRLIGQLWGYGDAGFRIANMAWLALLSAITWGVMRRFGRRTAWAAVLLFGIAYLHFGQSMSLQRDVVGIVPVAAALLVALWRRRIPFLLQALLIGLFCGMAASIKPQLALGLPILLIFLAQEVPEGDRRSGFGRRLSQASLAAAVGFLLPWAFLLQRVWKADALAAFWDMISGYLPLYLRMTGEHQTIAGFERLLYLLCSYLRFGGSGVWLLPAAAGVLMMTRSRRERRALWLLVALAALYSIYPVISGQFWDYHWMPSLYFLLLLAAFALAESPPSAGSTFVRWLPPILLALALILTLAPTREFYGQLWGQPPRPPNHGRVDEIAGFLQANLQPGDTVQPLDWTGGAVHAMLIAEAKLGTHFFYDFYFHHHISTPYIQNLRRRFIDDLQANRPRFIIDIDDKRHPTGPDTSAEFPELSAFIAGNYRVAVNGDGYIIYETSDR